MTTKAQDRHPFGELLAQYRTRKPGLTQTRLAELAGYDQAVLVRMVQGKKDLTGPSGRMRVVRLIRTLADHGALTTLDEANGLLLSANMAPLFEREPAEAQLITRLIHTQSSHHVRRTNLPAPLTHFIGRAQEADDIRRLLSTTRLLTLTGAGGAGKTRLAQRVAADVLIGYADGVWYVELASLTDPALIADAVTRALGLTGSDRPAQDQVTDYLRDRHVLLVLDNCEHLIAAVAAFSITLLRACPRLTILATSREALDTDGETAWRVPSLATNEAVQLFVDRAQAAQPDFILTDQNAATIAQVCHRLDGIPLAIELAAACLRMLSVEQIASRLDDRFRLLTGGSRTALPRHRTLRATVDWSYEQLSGDEQRLLRWLAVFAGGWTLEAAEALGAVTDVIAVQAQLVNKSLIIVDSHLNPLRYHLLEMIRQYAHERMEEAGEFAVATRAHFEYYVRLAREAEIKLGTQDQPYWLDYLEGELDNLRAALDWAAQHEEAQDGSQLAANLGQFWHDRGHSQEAMAWLKRLVLDRANIDPQCRVKGLFWAALNGEIEPNSAWKEWLIEARALALQLGDSQWIIDTKLHAANRLQMSLDETVAELTEVISLARRAGATGSEAFGMQALGQRLLQHGDLERAGTTLEKAVALWRVQGDRACLGESLASLGMVAFKRGDGRHAIEAIKDGITLEREVGVPAVVAFWLHELAIVATHVGHFKCAIESLREAFETYIRTDDSVGLVRCLCIAARLAQLTGRPELAVRLFGAVEDRRPHLLPFSFTYQERCDAWLDELRAELGPVAFDRAWVAGRAMTHEQAVAYALQEGEADEPLNQRRSE